MKRTFLFFLLAAVAVALCPEAATAQTTVTPGWLAWLGDGSEGAYSCTSGTCVLGGEHWFSSFTVASSATVVNTTINSPVIIRSTGACTVNGTISNSVNTAGGKGINFNGDFGGAGGGGGGGAVGALVEGQNGLGTVGIGGLPIDNGGPGGGAGAAGGVGQSVDRGQFHMILSSGTFWPVGGSAGGQGGCNGHGKCGGNGGAGGGPVILICSSLNFTGTIDASGAPGAPAPINFTGGGGGGGGGYVIFSTLSYVANTGAINVSGGAGGSCNTTGCAVGAAGGSGFDYFETIQ
jgi:hypothetical protein